MAHPSQQRKEGRAGVRVQEHGGALAGAQVPQALRAIVAYATRKAELSAEQRRALYNDDKADFERALGLWLPDDRARLRDALEGTRFIDWAHMAPELMRTFRSRGRLSVLEKDLPYAYNRNRHHADPEFANSKRVNQFLKDTSMKPGLPRLKRVHTLAMESHVDDLPGCRLGRIRSVAVIGDEATTGITHTQYKRIGANPYLSFKLASDSEVIKRGGPRVKGEIQYPDVTTVKPEALERIRGSHPDVYDHVCAFRARRDVDLEAERDGNSTRFKQLTESLVTALVEERYQNFEREARDLGELSTAAKILAYIRLVALLHRDIISIHPFLDGNGRSVRNEVLYALLDREGISRPRLHDPDADILSSPSGWVTEVERGILSTDALYRDIAERIRQGLRVENSPELVFSNLVREIGIDLRVRGSRRRTVNATLQKIDPAQFAAFVDGCFIADRSLNTAFRRDPVAVMSIMRQRYKEFAKSTLVLGSIPGKGIEQVGVRLVDFDFRSTFGVPLAHDPKRWKFKMARWYTRSMLWRGMASRDAEVSTPEILRIFTAPTHYSLSNRIAGLVPATPSRIRKEVQYEFDRYNTDLISGALTEMVRSHVEEGVAYDESYGLSTSRTWGIAAGFAWGRGVLGYDNTEVKARQREIKSRVVIGAYQCEKDVDVRRFKLIDPAFSYKFGRQQEVLAIGGIDPDAIMVVHLLDARRKIARSFVRNRAKPSEIWEIEGGFHPDRDDVTKLPREMVRRVYQLSSSSRNRLP